MPEGTAVSAMIDLGKAAVGTFCWLDLAATNAASAKLFYRQVFGWSSSEQRANGGSFTQLRLPDQTVASLYQLRREHLENGIQSHWTPYVQVDDVADAASRAVCFGGTVIINPFLVSGVARIALLLDSVGAQIGLWEPIQDNDAYAQKSQTGK